MSETPLRGLLAPHDLVPFADRVRYLQRYRAGLAALIALAWLLVPPVHAADPVAILAPLGGYALIALGAQAIWRLTRFRGIALFGALLMLDGVLLGWLVHATGGPGSVLAALVLVQVMVATLLGSFPTGIKMALWSSLLALATFDLEERGLLTSPLGGTPHGGDMEFWETALFVALIWIVAIASASYAAVNERELRRRRYDLEALARLAYRLERTTQEGAVGGVLADAVVDEFGLERAVVVALSGDQPALLASRGVEHLPGAAEGAPRSTSLLSLAAGSDGPLLFTHADERSDPWLAPMLAGARNLVVVPLRAESRTIAVLVAAAGGRFGARAERRVVDALERFASHAALALENARLLEQLRRTADTDGLTGVANRRAFDIALSRELARAQRERGRIGLLLLDLDHFKHLNDTHGHQTGDAVLRAVARTLDEQCRAADFVARYGGEEFAVILPGQNPEETAATAERLRAAVAGADGCAGVTASIGAASFPRNGVAADVLIAAADAAVYASKAAGRNRVTVA